MRRSLIVPVTVAAIGLLLLPVDTSIAAGVLPAEWRPYLWVAWPAALLLAVPVVYNQIRRPRPETPAVLRKRLDRAAGDLADAVERQWTAEAGSRLLHSPAPIRVRWSSLGRPDAVDLWTVLDTGAMQGRPKRLRGDLCQVAGVFRSVCAGQLMIVGEPAAGKSVMALVLTLGLLRDDPVPVLLPIASWNPHQEDLHCWLTRRITEEYPALANRDVYGPDAAMRLVSGGRVVPVLDGLDEMPGPLRPVALDAIDRAVTDRLPVVVTCRTAEYRSAVERNGSLLTHAAVLEIQPVALDDAASFLTGADPWPERWTSVLDYLRLYPDVPLAQVLRSPLMIALARAVYAVSGGTPTELLDTTRFPGRDEIERRLFDGFLRVSYPDQLARDRADRWLRFLAGLDDHDLAWWQLEHSVPRPVRAMAAGCTSGLVFGLAATLFISSINGLAYTLMGGAATGFMFTFGRIRQPSRIEVRFRGNTLSLLRRTLAGLATGLCLTLVAGLAAGSVAALTWIAALTVHLWLDAPPDVTTASSPRSILAQDRVAALTLGVIIGVALGPLAALTFFVPSGAAALTAAFSSGSLGVMAGGYLYGRVGALAGGITIATLSAVNMLTVNNTALTLGSRLAAGTAVGLGMIGVAAMSRAWGAFRLTQLTLALRGDLPFRLMRFLDDAHQRGVLRQSGTVYQFRHEHLRSHLVRQIVQEPTHPPRDRVLARRPR
jgi:hypothetical protein